MSIDQCLVCLIVQLFMDGLSGVSAAIRGVAGGGASRRNGVQSIRHPSLKDFKHHNIMVPRDLREVPYHAEIQQPLDVHWQKLQFGSGIFGIFCLATNVVIC